MSQEPPVISPLAVHRDCPRCAKPVPAVDLVTECPHCGYELRNPRPVPLAETIVHDPATPMGTPGSFVPLEPEAPDPLVGTDLGIYRVDALLGQGGMGLVYYAHHRDLHRPCALKVLLPQLAAQERDYVTRFMNEGRAAASLVHPNVITIHAVGEERGYHFLEMEFVPGRSLKQLIVDEQRLSPLRATALAARVADGLAEAHRVGIVHRDLKPDNVLLTLQGVPKLADFGLAKRLRGRPDGVPEGLCGTPPFMAPELFQGGDAGPTTDVYALGVTYYLMLAGRYPYSGTTLPSLMSSVLHEPLPNIRRVVPEVTLEMAECLGLFLDRNPANRPPDGIQAAQLLQAILGQTRDLDGMLGEAFSEDPSVEWVREGGRHRITVRLPGGRKQVVFAEPSSHGTAERLLLIYSTCCDPQPAYFEHALRLNSEMSHGSVAIREIDGRSRFVVVDTYPRATVDAEEIRRSVHEVAARADGVEKLLTGLDRE
ncbi:MAG: protein kinase domain-containing protein [Planctomycetaceae bacterium]